MSNIWWEKTVEYLFISLLTKKLGEHWVAPLDGKHEKAGDLIAGDERWVLIEFKRKKSSILSEHKKFGDKKFKKVKKALKESSGHHFIIYGEKKQGGLVLKSQGYFFDEASELETTDNIKNLLSKGIELRPFQDYLGTFIDAKGDEADGSIDYTMVMGVVIGSEKIVCMPMKGFLNIKEFIKQVTKEVKTKSMGK